jgi:hypothetical protein
MAKKKIINPIQEQYFLGGMFGSKTGGPGIFGQGTTPGSASGIAGMGAGMLGGLIPGQNKQGNTSIGGSAAKGALSGVAAGAMFGPLGMAIGGALGGIGGLFSGKKQQKSELEEEARIQQEQSDRTSRAALAQLNYSNSSNLPMAMGGNINPMAESPVGDFSHFATGGTHEENPYGGIPQGMSQDGKLRTVEAKESSFKFNEGKYIFSNRLIFE